jgi:hypothetical protein
MIRVFITCCGCGIEAPMVPHVWEGATRLPEPQWRLVWQRPGAREGDRSLDPPWGWAVDVDEAQLRGFACPSCVDRRRRPDDDVNQELARAARALPPRRADGSLRIGRATWREK